MKQESAKSNGSILVPVLMGSAVGAGIALLLATKSGKEIRRNLMRFAANTRDQVADVIDEGRGLYKEGREAVAGAVKAGRETYDEGTEMIGRLMQKKERSLMAPILVSGIIGAGIALLLAPKPGRETRDDLKRVAAIMRDRVVSAIEKGKELSLAGSSAASEALGKVGIALGHEKKKLRHAA